jgi:hypothetical protein
MEEGGRPEERGLHGWVVIECVFKRVYMVSECVCERVWLSGKGNCVDDLWKPALAKCICFQFKGTTLKIGTPNITVLKAIKELPI